MDFRGELLRVDLDVRLVVFSDFAGCRRDRVEAVPDFEERELAERDFVECDLVAMGWCLCILKNERVGDVFSSDADRSQ